MYQRILWKVGIMILSLDDVSDNNNKLYLYSSFLKRGLGN